MDKTDYEKFECIKFCARKLGCNGVWHNDGQIFVKMSSDDIKHRINSIDDLQPILDSYKQNSDSNTGNE